MKTPESTYRLQLHAGFDFDHAAEIADYLHSLGISHVYCSPYLQAAPGSLHGYDIVDHHAVNRELGGEAAHIRFCKRLGEVELGQLLDIVPNHMAISGQHNAMWWDILENGPSSRYASYFDIEWNPPEEKLRNKVLLPVLGDHYGKILNSRQLKLERRGGSFVFCYHEHLFPIAPRSLGGLLGGAATRCNSDYLHFLADSLSRLPPSNATDWMSVLARHRDKEVIRRLLERLCQEHSDVAVQIDASIREMNDDVEALDALLARQNYRLSYWRTAEHELAYRRFFDVNGLAGLRVENEGVFADTHAMILDWLHRGVIDGVRVDHPDGLRDPERYFRRLRDAAPHAWIVVEKILMSGETLREDWPVDGTTGYDFLNTVGALFIDSRGEAAMNEIYREFTRQPVDYSGVVREKKAQVLAELLGSDLNLLTASFAQICEQNRDYRDYTRAEIREAIREVIVRFPVYRTYIQAEQGIISDLDAANINQAVDAARAGRADVDGHLFEFIRAVLLLRIQGELESEFVMRFQQVTPPAMAKGTEDTALYSYNRLVALNEVGGHPGRFGGSVDEFHRLCQHLHANWPATMTATSTHDTKRSEDVRARIGLLSELPLDWSNAVRRWSALSARHRNNGTPDRNTEYLIYQTLVGTWPISAERLQAYMQKATREAKEQTSWVVPNAAFEVAVNNLIDGLLGDAAFIADLEAFLMPIAAAARVTSLAQTLLKLTAPGVPDIYQGTELWDFSLVDPDNRRTVDYGLRRRLLCELNNLTPAEILMRSEEGLPKLWTIRQCLRTRRSMPKSFSPEGSYRPLWPAGPKASNLIAFQRGDDVVSVAPRLMLSLGDGWESTYIEIGEGPWRNRLSGDLASGGKVNVGELLRGFPVALLVKDGSPE